MNGNFCPISRLPIVVKPEWTDIELSKNYHVSFQKIGNYILNHVPVGEMKEFDAEHYFEIREKVIKDAFPSGIKIIDLKNYNFLKGSPRASERIKVYDRLIKEQYRCQGVIIYNGSTLVRLMYQTAFATVNKLPYSAKVALDYPGAIRIAMDILGMNKSGNSILIDQGFFQREDWILKKADHTTEIEFMVSNDNILYGAFKGELNTDDETFSFLKKTLFQIFEDHLLSNGFFIIADYSHHLHSDINFRRKFFSLYEDLGKTFKTTPHIAYICGANNSIKTSFLLTRPFSQIEFINNYLDALNKIRSDENIEKTQKSILVPQKDIETLISIIGNIAWEKEIDSKITLDPNSPLKYAEEALSLVNIDRSELITELKVRNEVLGKVVKELKEARDLAEAGSKAKSNFLANMSHELRTPLNGIIGLTDLLKETPLSEEQRSFVSIIQQSGDHLLSLINDILDHSRIESGKIVLEKSDFNFHDFIGNIGEMMAHKAYEKHLAFLINVDSSVYPDLSGDVFRLKQILLNFISNAIKFTSSGYVSLNVTSLSDSDSHQDILFEIQDSGIGIEKENIELLFRRFTQVDSSITRKYGGTGLGLAIAKQLIDLMDGTVGVRSSPGEGSCFHFCIPFTKSSSHKGYDVSGYKLNSISSAVFAEHDAEQSWYIRLLTDMGCSINFSGKLSSSVDNFIHNKDAINPDLLIILDQGISNGTSMEYAYRKIMRTFPDNRFKFIFPWNSNILVKPDFQFDTSNFLLMKKPVFNWKLRKAITKIFNTDQQKAVTDKPSSIQIPVNINTKEGKILIAEDLFTNQIVIERLLQKLGLNQFVICNNGLEAINELKEKDFDLVLMDCNMPVMDGYTASQQIRDPHVSVRKHDIPIIALTAHVLQDELNKCSNNGMNDYLLKPVTLNSLREKLKKWGFYEL